MKEFSEIKFLIHSIQDFDDEFSCFIYSAMFSFIQQHIHFLLQNYVSTQWKQISIPLLSSDSLVLSSFCVFNVPRNKRKKLSQDLQRIKSNSRNTKRKSLKIEFKSLAELDQAQSWLSQRARDEKPKIWYRCPWNTFFLAPDVDEFVAMMRNEIGIGIFFFSFRFENYMAAREMSSD